MLSDEIKFPERCLSGKRLDTHLGFDVADIIRSQLQKKISAPWTRETGVYHPSSIYMCKRALYYDRRGDTPIPCHSTYLQGIFEIGHALHEVVQDGCRKAHPASFEDEIRIACDYLSMAGHTDGVFKLHDWIVEFKTMGQKELVNLIKPKKDHIAQVHCYMWSTDIPRAQIVYINKTSLAPTMFPVFFDNRVMQTILDRVEYVDGQLAKGEEVPREINKYNCGSCKFAHICKPRTDKAWT